MASTRLLTVTELASVLRLAPSTLRLWARMGRIPCVRLSSRALRFDSEQVRRALSEPPFHISTAIEEALPGLLGDQAEDSDL